jgi:hypothetical protein
MLHTAITLRSVNSLYTVNVNEILIVVEMVKTIKKDGIVICKFLG